MSNSDTEYEKFVQQIYQRILQLDGHTNITVQHNVKVTGRQSGIPHQIDVYWEFSVGGIIHKVCIECKNFKNPVPKGRLMEFARKINDIGARGIFVTRTGYQSGAKKWADFDNIDIFTAREMTESDLIKWTKRIQVKIELRTPHVYDVKLNFVNLPDNVDLTKVNGKFQMDKRDIVFCDENGKKMFDLKQYIDLAIKLKSPTMKEQWLEEVFNPPITIVGFNGLKLPLRAISFKYKHDVSHRSIDGEIRHQMRNEVTGETRVWIKLSDKDRRLLNGQEQ